MLWETGALYSYLIDIYDIEKALSHDTLKEKYHCEQWLAFQVRGRALLRAGSLVSVVGSQTECSYPGTREFADYHRRFTLLHSEKIPSAIERYQNEVRRILGVIEGWLDGKEWLVRDKMTYADLAFVPYNDQVEVVFGCSADAKFNDFPRVKAWHMRMASRPSWKKAMDTRAKLL